MSGSVDSHTDFLTLPTDWSLTDEEFAPNVEISCGVLQGPKEAERKGSGR
jgi:hypothetical protein